MKTERRPLFFVVFKIGSILVYPPPPSPDQHMGDGSKSDDIKKVWALPIYSLYWERPSCSHTAMSQYRKWKHIFPEKEMRGHSPNFHIHVSVSDLYIPTIYLPILLQEICGPIPGIYK